MGIEKPERRAPRKTLSLPIWVERQEKNKKSWREVIPLKTISPIGASFYLKREIEVGQLVFLTMPLPAEFRCYDLTEENYSVWGIVRHCNPISKKDPSTFYIGVAFVGQTAPRSYRQNPSQIYEISHFNEKNFWEIREIDPTIRRETRYSISVNVYIALIDDQEQIIGHEQTVTENISLSGVSVFSSLDVKIGEKVKIMKKQGGFSAFAIVRQKRLGDDNLPRLHLEIIDSKFPIEGVG